MIQPRQRKEKRVVEEGQGRWWWCALQQKKINVVPPNSGLRSIVIRSNVALYIGSKAFYSISLLVIV